MESNPSSPNVRAYPKEKKYIRSIRESNEIEPDIIRRIVDLHKEVIGTKLDKIKGSKKDEN